MKTGKGWWPWLAIGFCCALVGEAKAGSSMHLEVTVAAQGPLINDLDGRNSHEIYALTDDGIYEYDGTSLRRISKLPCRPAEKDPNLASLFPTYKHLIATDDAIHLVGGTYATTEFFAHTVRLRRGRAWECNRGPFLEWDRIHTLVRGEDEAWSIDFGRLSRFLAEKPTATFSLPDNMLFPAVARIAEGARRAWAITNLGPNAGLSEFDGIRWIPLSFAISMEQSPEIELGPSGEVVVLMPTQSGKRVQIWSEGSWVGKAQEVSQEMDQLVVAAKNQVWLYGLGGVQHFDGYEVVSEKLPAGVPRSPWLDEEGSLWLALEPEESSGDQGWLIRVRAVPGRRDVQQK